MSRRSGVPTQFGHSIREDPVVVEPEELGVGEDIANRPEPGFGGVVGCRMLDSRVDLGPVDDGDHSHPGVPTWCAIGPQLPQMIYLDASLLGEFSTSRIGEVLIDVDEATWKRPAPLERLFGSSHQEHMGLILMLCEHHYVSRHRKRGVVRRFVSVRSFRDR